MGKGGDGGGRERMEAADEADTEIASQGEYEVEAAQEGGRGG